MSKILEKRFTQERLCVYDLYEPEGSGPKSLLIALHGYGGNKESMMRFARSINNNDYLIASLQGPHQHVIKPSNRSQPLRYGFGWITNFKPEESIELHHDALLRIIKSLENEGKIDSEKIFLLGFSQPVALNFRFAFTFPNKIRGIVGICGGIPGDLTEAERYQSTATDVLYIAGDKDEIYPPNTMLENAKTLERFADNVEIMRFDIDHKISAASIPIINQWIATRL